MTGSRERWLVRASVAGLLAVLCFLAGFSVITQQRVATESKRADTAMKLSATYQDARDWVGEEQSEERRYRFEGSSSVRFTHDAAADRLVSALEAVRKLDPSPANRPPSLSCWASMRVTATPARSCSGPSTPATSRRPALRPRGHRSCLRRPGGRRLAPGRRRPGDRARTQRVGPGARGACDASDDRRVRRRPRPARLLRGDHPALPPPARRRPRRRARAPLGDRHQRPAHRPAQPPRVPRGPRAGGAARQPHRHPARARAPGRRRPQDRQRQAGTPGRRRASARPSRTRSAPHSAPATAPTASAATSSRSRSPTPAPTARWSSRSACARPRSPATMASRSPSPRASPRRSSSAPRTIWCARPTSR